MSLPSPGARVRRVINAPIERVFSAFGDAKLVAQWLRPAPEVKLTVLTLDFRPGGAYRFAYDTPDGQRMLVGGVYREIERPSRIVFSWLIEAPDLHAGIDSEVTVKLSQRGDGTELFIHHAKFDRPDADSRHEQGWYGALTLLDPLVVHEAGATDHPTRSRS